MENKLAKKCPTAQETYRENQDKKGFTRYEIQVLKETKKRFEAVVKDVADEYAHPFSLKQRMAKARADLFAQLTKNITHEFFHLKDQITALKAEIKALSPSFFKSDQDGQIPLPEAISVLSDDPTALKQVLARTYQDCQQAKKKLQNTDEWLKRYQALHEAAECYNEQLKTKLSRYEAPPSIDE